MTNLLSSKVNSVLVFTFGALLTINGFAYFAHFSSVLATLAWLSPLALASLAGLSIALSFIENQIFSKTARLLAVLVLVAGCLPFVFKPPFAGNPTNWALTHFAFALSLLVMPRIDRGAYLALLKWLLVASTFSLVFGSAAISVDSRSWLIGGRLTGVFGHPNVTGMAAIACVVLCIWLKETKTLFFVNACLVVVLSLSLTSLVALSAALLIWLLKSQRAKKLVTVSLAAATLIPIVLTFAIGLHIDESLFTGRAGVWWILAHFDTPVLSGFGPGFIQSLLDGGDIPWFHAHDEIIMEYVSGGVPMLLTGIAVIFALAIKANRKSDGLAQAVAVAFFVYAITEVPLFLDNTLARLPLAFIMLGTILAQSNPAEQMPVAARKRQSEQTRLV